MYMYTCSQAFFIALFITLHETTAPGEGRKGGEGRREGERKGREAERGKGGWGEGRGKEGGMENTYQSRGTKDKRQ